MHASRCLRTLLWLPVPGPAARASATLGLPALDRWGSPLSSVPIASLWRACQIQRWHMLPRRGHQPVLLTGCTAWVQRPRHHSHAAPDASDGADCYHTPPPTGQIRSSVHSCWRPIRGRRC